MSTGSLLYPYRYSLTDRTYVAGHREAQALISQFFLRVPETIASGNPAVFVHPKLQILGGQSHILLIKNALDGVVQLDHLQKLTNIDITQVDMEKRLTALQTLLVFTAPLLISEEPGKQERAEPWLKIADAWAQDLLHIARAEDLGNRTPWQQWLLAESVRRTIAMTYVLQCCFNAWKHGYCSNWLFLESLPFDRRPGLWMAMSPQAWIAAAGCKIGQQVGTQLTSVHEFGTNMKATDSTFCGDQFLSMVVISHNGSAAPPKTSV